MARRVRASDPTKRVRRKPAPVEVRQVCHPGIYRTARKLAGGDLSRVEVLSATRVEVKLP